MMSWSSNPGSATPHRR